MTTKPSDMKPSEWIDNLRRGQAAHGEGFTPLNATERAIIAYLDEQHAAGQGEPRDGHRQDVARCCCSAPEHASDGRTCLNCGDHLPGALVAAPPAQPVAAEPAKLEHCDMCGSPAVLQEVSSTARWCVACCQRYVSAPLKRGAAVSVAGGQPWPTAYEAWQRIPEHEQIKLAGTSWRAGFDAGQIVNKELLRERDAALAQVEQLKGELQRVYATNKDNAQLLEQERAHSTALRAEVEALNGELAEYAEHVAATAAKGLLAKNQLLTDQIEALTTELSQVRASCNIWHEHAAEFADKQKLTKDEALIVAWNEGLVAGQHTLGLNEDEFMPQNPYTDAAPQTKRQIIEVDQLQSALTAANERAARLAKRIETLPEHFDLSSFVNAGLSIEGASTALMVSRRIMEDAERAAEASPPVATGERPIVVGSNWQDKARGDVLRVVETTAHFDNATENIVCVDVNEERSYWTSNSLRVHCSHISDPPAPATGGEGEA